MAYPKMKRHAETIITVLTSESCAYGCLLSALTFADALISTRVPCGTSSGEYEEPCGLPQTADDERHTTSELQAVCQTRSSLKYIVEFTNLLHDIHATKRAAKVDSTEDDLCHERVLDSYGLEDGRAILGVRVHSE